MVTDTVAKTKPELKGNCTMNMKKIIALALAAVMVLAFAACAKQNSENGTTTPSDTASAKQNGENSTTAPSDDQKGQPQSALEILEKV